MIDSKQQNTVIQGKHIVIGARDTLILKGGTKVIRDDDAAEDKVKGSYKMEVQGGYNLNSGKLSLGSMGSTSISSFGPITQTITGNSEETIANADVIFGNLNAWCVLYGKICKFFSKNRSSILKVFACFCLFVYTISFKAFDKL